jgi:hypothetical protein
VPRRILYAIYGASVRYGYRPGRVLWLLAALLILVIASLMIPAGRATMRTTDPYGDVYSASGVLRNTGGAAQGASAPRPDSCGDGQVRCFSPVFYAIGTQSLAFPRRSRFSADSRHGPRHPRPRRCKL